MKLFSSFLVLFVATSSAGCLPRGASSEATSSDSPTPHERAMTTTLDPPPRGGGGVLDRLPDIVEQTLPGVVGISTKKTVRVPASPFGPFGSPFTPFFEPPGGQGQGQERLQRGMGSGVIVTKDGVILTNNHVIDGADEIDVALSDERTFEAEVVGADPKSDIAVVKLKNPPPDLQPLSFGDSDALRLGEAVVAIGSPFGLSSTVTLGIVSAKGRANVGIVDYEDFIQTDAAINPGNSGGALVNGRGELVGINTAIMSRNGAYQGIGFAIPSNMARTIQGRLLADGKVSRGWLGVAIQSITPELAQAFGLDPNARGVIVSDVQKNSPAEKAGIKRGDVLVKLNDRAVDDASELRNMVALQPPGTHVGLELIRDGRSRVVDVELGDLGLAGPVGSLAAVADIKGLHLGPVDAAYRARHNLPDELEGVAVVEVEAGSPAARTGLHPGDVVMEVNRRKVRTVQDFAAAYKSSAQRVLFLLYREGATIFLAVPKP